MSQKSPNNRHSFTYTRHGMFHTDKKVLRGPKAMEHMHKGPIMDNKQGEI